MDPYGPITLHVNVMHVLISNLFSDKICAFIFILLHSLNWGFVAWEMEEWQDLNVVLVHKPWKNVFGINVNDLKGTEINGISYSFYITLILLGNCWKISTL